MSINRPSKDSFVKPPAAVLVVASIWILTSVSNVPMFMWSSVKFDSVTKSYRCMIADVNPTARAVQITIVRIFDYFLPLIVTWVCYLGLVFKMKAATSKVSKLRTEIDASLRLMLRKCNLYVYDVTLRLFCLSKNSWQLWACSTISR